MIGHHCGLGVPHDPHTWISAISTGKPGPIPQLTCMCPGRELRWVDLFGIDPDYTEGKPIDEWLDEQRGEA